VGPRGALLHGLLVGLLVAIGPLFGLVGPPSPLAATLTVATGLLGGWEGKAATPFPKAKGRHRVVRRISVHHILYRQATLPKEG
jgi:hypothetical protein